MTKKDFSLMLGNIGDKYIVEAYAYVESHKRKFIPKRWIALAACIILIVAAFPIGIMLENSGWFTPVGTGPITTAPTVVTDPPPSHVHEWGKWSLIRMATASEEGLEERVCECGEKETNAFPLGSEGLTYKLREKTEDEIIITGLGTCTDTDLKIGTYIDGYRVVGITEYVFRDCKNIVSVTIPYGIQYISKAAFRGCTSLETVTMPDGVLQINADVFRDCTALKSINMPDTLKVIGGGAFQKCTSLESIRIPDNIEEIGMWAFMACSSLKSIKLPSSLKNLGNGVFYECYSLENVTLENGITSIPCEAFDLCTSLKSIVIPESVKSIEGEAFAGCSALENVTMSDNITSIKDHAFHNCIALQSIYIPKNIEVLNQLAFLSCYNIKDITFNDTKEKWNNILKYGSPFEQLTQYTVHCIDGDITTNALFSFTYEPGVAYKEFGYSITGVTVCKSNDVVFPEYIFGEKVVMIRGKLFENNTSITSAVIPSHVEYAGSGLFSGCTNLKSVTLPNTLQDIKFRLFEGCTSLTDIYFKGTKAEWVSLKKYSQWDDNTPDYTIHCTDGDIKKGE